MAGIGDNGHLKSFVERIEHCEEAKREILVDIKEIYAEAKSNGFDVKVLRKVIRLRKMQEAILETYMHALGMLADLPLGQAAMERVRGGAEA